jgi:hypothetical protein
VIWHAQVGNLNEALHQINLRDMLDASLLMSTSDIALEQLGARADKAGLQQPFANFLAAHDQLVGTRRHPERTKPMAAYRAAKITSPPSQNTRTLELALHYLKTGIRNPSRLLNGLRALLAQGPMGHAKRILEPAYRKLQKLASFLDPHFLGRVNTPHTWPLFGCFMLKRLS